MILADIAATAASNLGRRKGRTALTAVGVLVGVGALVLMVSLGLGLERTANDLFSAESLLRSIQVQRAATGSKSKRTPPFLEMLMIPSEPVTDEDIAEIRKLPEVETVVPQLSLMLAGEISGVPDGEMRGLWVGPVMPEEEDEFRRAIVAGTAWEAGERACVVSLHFVRLRFPEESFSIIGKTLRFMAPGRSPEGSPDDAGYRIAGVVDNDQFGPRAALYLPFHEAKELRERMKGGALPLTYRADAYLACDVIAKRREDVAAIERKLGNMGFQTLSRAEALRTMNVFFLFLEGFLGCIGAVGLLVALFGIANTMAMAVLERTREIGILKSLGARGSDIRRIFLLEAAGIGLGGGAVGLAGGALVGGLLNAIAHRLVELPADLKLFHVSIPLAVFALVFSTLISMAAGWVPAMRAARLDPVLALRYE
ncbi:MAG: ABC transporter permease [Planctomycetes bacterium]|nr:ABC transporter permease [Planctomycetota bacterium]